MKLGSVASSAVWVLGLVFLLCPGDASAGAPTDQIRTTVEKIQEILNDAGRASESMRADRRARLRAVIYPRFDFTEMAMRSLGAEWRRRTPEEQKEFVEVFTKLLEKSYVDKIESYHGEKILYGREVQEQDFAEVDTKIVGNKGDQVAVNYRLRRVDGDWKVYDVVIENISLVNNYRAQFSRVLASSSFAELLRRIKEKI
jgi:phospholipid transport system substrate-binding protein